MRLFTAICFDDETKNKLSFAAEEAKKQAEGNFTAKENFHLTLVFIGESDRKEDIENALSKIEFPSFDFRIAGVGSFEKGIFWAGTEENENLERLYLAVKKSLFEIGIETEDRKYIPHITLARKFRPKEGFDSCKTAALLPKEKQRAAKISLMKSERIEGVLQYTEIWSKELT